MFVVNIYYILPSKSGHMQFLKTLLSFWVKKAFFFILVSQILGCVCEVEDSAYNTSLQLVMVG